MFCTSMIDVANDLNIPCYLYFASPAAYLGFVLHLTTLSDTKSTDSANGLSVPSFSNPVPSTAFPLFCINKNELGYSWFVHHTLRYKETKGIVVNTFQELEPYALDSLSSDYIDLPPVYPVGPVVDHVGPVKWHSNRSMHEKAIQWLDRQPDFSVVFLCFGSMGSLNRDQVSVLAHKAIGGFVSHCGWNSILESISYGVPIATWPLYAEQHLNAFEMVTELGLSVEIRMGKGGDLVLADEVERGVRELMDGGDGELKKKVKEMSDKAKKALTKNGSSFQALKDLMNILLSQI
ncbi:putative anthocyanidin 3-O-glucosyltransferase [Helianthus annuus]|nr:putative anthocyanidin 3-O-glucosyltransferase [Helianthus annuus]